MKVVPVHLVDLVDRGDVGMVERRGCLSFLNEAALALGIGDEVGGKDFEGDLPVELEIHSAVDNAHAAAADLFEDLVVRKGSPDHDEPPGEELSPATDEKSKTCCDFHKRRGRNRIRRGHNRNVMDEFNSAGLVPASLLRWKLTRRDRPLELPI